MKFPPSLGCAAQRGSGKSLAAKIIAEHNDSRDWSRNMARSTEEQEIVDLVRARPESFAVEYMCLEPGTPLYRVFTRLARLDPEPSTLRCTDGGPLRGEVQDLMDRPEWRDRENWIDFRPRLPRFWI